jgi:lipopolysaccharide transport system permease protein
MTSIEMRRGVASWGRRRQGADLLYELVARDVKLRYRRSVLGVAWSLLAPLTLMGVLSFVFTRVVPLGIENYAVFVFTGLLAWTWFATSIVTATESVVGNADLVRQPGFPLPLLPIAAIGSNLVNYLLALPILLGAILVTTHRPSITVVVLPVILAVQFVLTLGVAYFLAAYHVTFRDIAHIVGIVLLPLFYATPVFYGEAQIPHRFELVFDLNPMRHILSAHRAILLDGRWPDWNALLVLTCASLILAAAGYRVFTARARRFSEEL